MVTDVVVVGGGPVGMLLAAELRLNGVDVVVLEKLSAPSGHSRAFRLQPRTLEILDSRGLLDRFADGRTTWPSAHFAGLRPLLELGALDSAHPHSLLIPQARTEALLEEHAVVLGADVRRGHEVVGLRQNAGPGEDPDRGSVTVRFAGPNGEAEIEASHVVGCDGGRSTIRGLAGIPFPGIGGSVSALLGDVVLADRAALPSGVPGTLRTPQGLLMAVKLEEGVTRILTTEFGRDPGARDAPVTLAELTGAVRRVTGAEVELRDPRWLSRFSDATCLAGQYRAGRVLLAGDAAHVHFPIGAQGLNLGLQDAMNLGWKLADTVRGRAPGGLLDTYGAERRPVAERVLRETRAQLALMNPDERIDPLREMFSELLALDPVNAHLAGLTAGLDVRYAAPDTGTEDPAGAHALVGGRVPELSFTTAAGPVRVAELLRAGRPVLVDAADGGAADVSAAWAGRVDVVRAAPPGANGCAALLVRPDGYVAWAAGPGAFEAPARPGLRAALTQWFGAPGD
ncbi:FAD-dependent monooxygenase [Streptomyces sp. HD]|uniref:FAD-dependent monooxygenase n=1 Tax=Streptomyces sp. HD TaxID=3020892 RepID=UPI00232D3472|nr:FAD-dependent monooxygenase [Streptomyces sp. HD]MDC0772583.1 FAD-dependent monooxygenase [Streptomyces sp. HD]